VTDDETVQRRLRACRDALDAAGADGLVCSPGPNLSYLSGFTEESSERHLFLLVGEAGAVFVVPSMYVEQVRSASPVGDVRGWDDGTDPMALVETAATAVGIDDPDRLLVDDRMWARFTLDLRATFEDVTVGLTSEVTDDLRVVKDTEERAALSRAAAVADGVSESVRSLGADAVGTTEAELAREVETRLFEAGCESASFEVVAAAGPNGAMPHHRHGDREIRAGDPVVLDFGGRVDGYPGDQTRTVVFDGDPPEGFETVHGVVREALDAGVDTVEPGVEAETVDRAAREVIENAGYGDQFLHRTGHGIGLEVHEKPYIVAGNDRVLEPGMVFSVEPGIYLDGEYGVRIEDIVVVTDEGCERLNNSSRTWKPLSS
jgi:Xaa-Pro aminopeptidase